jgi:branched-chain amino acid transport system substrate-binding protein
MKAISTLGLALGFAVAVAGSAAAQVPFGVAGPITGPNAATGAQMKNGVDQAAADINAKGGILGKQITVEYGDDVSDPKQGVSVANKFAGDGIKFVIGHYNSGVTIPASEVYQENGILEITPASTNPTVTERGMWNIFRTCGRDDQQGKVAGGPLQGQKDRLRQRQDHLRQRPRRRNFEDDQGRRHARSAL